MGLPLESLHLSRLLGSRVVDATGRRIGWVADAVARQGGLFPPVRALVIRRSGARALRAPWSVVEDVRDSEVVLSTAVDDTPDYTLQEGDILLAAEVLDKQIVDTHGRRLVKVNDLKLVRMQSDLRVVGVDVGARGLLRRIHAEGATERIAALVGRTLPEALIPWRYVESIPARGGDVRLSVPWTRLESLHPADLSRIIGQLPEDERAAAIEQLSDETIAETMGGFDTPTQTAVFEALDDKRASDILERMAPDEAADLLQALPEQRRADLLVRMEQKEATALEHLLRYDERTAGGLMTTEFIALPAHLTAEEAIRRVRELAPDAETVYYLYVVDDEGRLAGVLSLRNLITSPPDRRIEESMTTAVVSVPASMDQEQVAAVMAKYHLLALPVVDETNRLLGIVTVDDTIDVVDEEAEEDLSHIAGTPAETPEEHERGRSVALNRSPWVLLALTAGLLAANALHHLAGPFLSRGIVFLPLLFLIGSQVAAQAAATTARGIALREVDRANWWAHSRTELQAAIPLAGIAAAAAATAGALWGGPAWALAVGLSAAAMVVGGSVVGLLVPLAEAAVHLDPAMALRPIVVSLVAFGAPVVYALLVGAFVG